MTPARLVLLGLLLGAAIVIASHAFGDEPKPFVRLEITGHKAKDERGQCVCAYEQWRWPCEASAQQPGQECVLAVEVPKLK